MRRGVHGLSLGVSTAALMACSSPQPSPPDASRAGPRTYTYVFRSIAIDETDAPDVPHTGFNLDGLTSTESDADGCNHADYFSALDPDQDRAPGCGYTPGVACGGVDNQFPTLVAALQGVSPGLSLNDEFVARIAAGQFGMMIQVGDVDSLQDDPDVAVRVFMGVPTAADCGALFNNGEYAVLASSVAVGGHGPADANFTARGAIVGGRLRVAAGDDTALALLLPPVMGVNLGLNWHAPRLRVSLSDTGGTAGNLGGWLAATDLLATVITPEEEQRVADIVGAFGDLARAGVCYQYNGSPALARFGNIGVGLGFTLVPARIAPGEPVASRIPGACGSPPPLPEPPPHDAAIGPPDAAFPMD